MKQRSRFVVGILVVILIAFAGFEFVFYPGPIGVVKPGFISEVTGSKYNVTGYNSTMAGYSLTGRSRVTLVSYSDMAGGDNNSTVQMQVHQFVSHSSLKKFFYDSAGPNGGNQSLNITGTGSNGTVYRYIMFSNNGSASGNISYIMAYKGNYLVTLKQTYTNTKIINRGGLLQIANREFGLVNEEDLLI